MTREEFAAEFRDATLNVTAQMAEFVRPFVTPISKSVAEDYGTQWGSGSFVTIGERRYLVSCEHVFKARLNAQLGYQFVGSNNVYRLGPSIASEGAPIDAGLAVIPDPVWKHVPHSSAALQFDRFAAKHEPVEGELLFLVGYSGDHSRFAFGTLNAQGTPYTTQEAPISEEDERWDPSLHFALEYRPDLAISADPRARGLPTPPGFSGSLVWNTRFIESWRRDELWEPELARVTGMVWGWPSRNACLLATKVEHLPFGRLVQELDALPLETTASVSSSAGAAKEHSVLESL